MVTVNGVEMPMRRQSGLLVLEDPSGHQSWALISSATVEYGDAEFTADDPPEMKVVTTLAPGEMLRTASTIEVGEENVLVYSRMLVAVLREERDRYAELEKLHAQRGAALSAAQAENRRLAEDRAEALHESWADGARNGFVTADAGLPLEVAFERNPHPEPEDDEEPGCHICGGPDH